MNAERSKAIIPRSKTTPLNAEELVDLVVGSLDDHKAEDVVVIDLRGKSSIAEHMVIATGTSSRQVGAMADHLMRALKTAGQGVACEGLAQCDWVLIDGGDIVVHLFRPEVRAFYNLEKMWLANKTEGLVSRPPAPRAPGHQIAGPAA